MKLFRIIMMLMLTCATAVQAQKYVGGDISLLSKYETNGAVFLDNSGKKITQGMMNYFKEQGWNAMRVRLFVDPSKASEEQQKEGVCQNLAFVKNLGKQIKDAGLKLMLDFHYSDTWTDPGKHSTPGDWTSSDPEVLSTTLYNYTKECLNELIEAGVTPDFVQPGNEITYGMLWPTGHCYPDGGNYGTGTFANFAKYLLAGIKAIREVCPQAKIVIQTEMSKTANVTNFYRTLNGYTTDYDIIGLSYYPHFHGTMSTLNSLLTTLESNYPNKKIQLVETGYYHAWYPSNASYPISTFPTWPATDDGQLQFTKDLIATLNNHQNVDGLYWWFPEANEYGLNESNHVTTGWYNAGLFDNATGKAMKSLYALKYFVSGESVPEESTDQGDITTQYLVNPTFDSNINGWTNTSGTAQWKQDSWETLNNYCEFKWTGSTIINQEVVQSPTLPAGNYKLAVNCAANNGAKGLYLVAGNQQTEMVGTGNPETFTVEFTVDTQKTVKLGVQLLNTTATWINFDNFSLNLLSTSYCQLPIDNSQSSITAPYYTLSGQRLSGKPATKGIYIADGKKVIVR